MSTPISGSSSSSSTSLSPADQAALTQANANQQIASLLSQSGPTISFGGLVSGINTQQIVQALLSAAQAPVLQLQAQQANEQGKLIAWQNLNDKLQDLQTATDSLSLQGVVAAKQLTFAGPSGTFATGTATSSAAAGSFQLQVDQLATATQVVSTSGAGAAIVGTDIVSTSSKLSTPVTAGSFTVNGHQITITTGEDFNTILADIGTQTGGDVTASIAGNTIQLVSNNGQPIQLGNTGDTSNFLSVTKLLGQPAALSITSSGPVGVVNPNVALDQANVNGLTSTNTGSFVINGVTINYNSATDTLNDVLGRINTSAAGVTASYDSNSDRVTFTSSQTGNLDISLSDGSGNLLSSLNVGTAAAHQVGNSAKYEVNGGPAQYSLSNSIKNVVPGVNVSLQAVTPAGQPITGTVALDSSSGTAAIQDFVTAYNAVIDLIQKDTAYDTQTKVAGIFLGEPTITTIQQQLDEAVFISNGTKLGLASGFSDLSAIGISTGPIGSAPGTTTDLQFDATKFADALSNNTAAVTNLVTTVFHNMSQSVLTLTQPFGVVDSAMRAENNTIADYQDQIDVQTDFLKQQEDFLNQEFTTLDTQLSALQSQSSTGASVLASLGSNAASASTSK